MTTEEIKGSKEEASDSVKWLFGGNYTNEQTETFEQIIRDFESLCYLERQNILNILSYIYQEEIDDEEVINNLLEE